MIAATVELLVDATYELACCDHIEKAEGVMRLCSWIVGAGAALESIREKASWCERLDKDLEGHHIDIHGHIFSVEHAATMQALLQDSVQACSRTRTRIENLHQQAYALLKGGAA